jgi:2,3-dihydroxy-p-cumate/2,3-dihydroxybenzoate 3,4-dioxygenase
VLNVTDPQQSRAFYETLLGLQFVEQGAGGELHFRCGFDHHNLILCRSATPGLRRIGWEMQSEADVEALANTLNEAGIAVVEVPDQVRLALRQSRTLRYACPFTGATMEFFSRMQELGGEPFKPTVAQIQRLGHIVMRAPRFAEALDFYRNVLGFKVSDEIEGAVAFMRCHPNPLHHSLALAPAQSASLHHVNFMVTEVDDIGRAIWRFKKAGITVVHGPGRHPPSGSMFLYFLDPDGLTIEYSFGMEEFPEIDARKPRLLVPGQPSLDYWGAIVDPRKGKVGAIETPASLNEADGEPGRSVAPAKQWTIEAATSET